MEQEYHIPVLKSQCIEALCIGDNGIWIDTTFGGGGHSRAMLEKMGPKAHLYAFDQDSDALRNAPNDKRFTLIHSNFRFLRNWMDYYQVDAIDGLLADLGVSSHHFDDSKRGFSFREDGPLDMRMNTRAHTTAAELVNKSSQQQLADILYNYGELRNSRQLASAIINYRNKQAITTTQQFLDALEPVVSKSREKKDLAKIFQAIRIEINGEMTALKEMLMQAIALLRPGGRMAILTYHSLEDRIVKNIIRSGNTQGHIEHDFYGNRITPLRAVNSYVIVPTEQEQALNPRSRSAKLRIAQKIG